MSASANWSYTSTATWWPYLGMDDWTGVATYGSPVLISCDYKADSVRATDQRGVEFITSQILYTEFAGAKYGDRLLIGDHTSILDPVAYGALEIKSVTRYADTFDLAADDYKLMTSGVTLPSTAPPSTGDKLILETGFRLLLESGDAILLEA